SNGGALFHPTGQRGRITIRKFRQIDLLAKSGGALSRFTPGNLAADGYSGHDIVFIRFPRMKLGALLKYAQSFGSRREYRLDAWRNVALGGLQVAADCLQDCRLPAS